MNDTETNGVLVILVSEGSPDALAGIINGTSENSVDTGNNVYVNTDSDIIIGIDAKPVNKVADILNYIHDKSIGDTIILKVLGNGEINTASITLAERP
jgi:S1-C subfamily serine protease